MEHAGIRRHSRYHFGSSLEEPSGEAPATFKGASNVLLSPERSSEYILNASKKHSFIKGSLEKLSLRVTKGTGWKFLIEHYWLSKCAYRFSKGFYRPKGTPNGTSSIFQLPQIPCGSSWSCTNPTYAKHTAMFTSARSLTLVLHWTFISFTFPWWTSVRQNTFPEEQKNRLLSKCAFGTDSGM